MTTNERFEKLLKRANNFPPVGASTSDYFKFVDENQALLSFIPLEIVPYILKETETFDVDQDLKTVSFKKEINSHERRSNALANVCQRWREMKVHHSLSKWRDELYPVYSVSEGNKREEMFVIERSACGLFGFPQFGCHLNAFVVDGDQIKVWVARRSPLKQTYPGMLDNTVGGGLPAGIDPWTNIIKEAQEEASLPPNLTMKNARYSGAVSFYYEAAERGIIPDTQFLFELDLSPTPDVVPVPQDGEVEEFVLMGIDEIKERLAEFTPGAMTAMLHFLKTRGNVSQDLNLSLGCLPFASCQFTGDEEIRSVSAVKKLQWSYEPGKRFGEESGREGGPGCNWQDRWDGV